MEKAALRASAIFELGERFDDKLERKRSDMSSAKGAVAAFSEAGKSVEGLMVHVDKELEEEKITLEQAKTIKSWMTRCQYAILSLNKKAENQVFIAQGQVAAIIEVIESTKKFYDVESSKIPKIEDFEQPEEAVDEPKDEEKLASGDSPKNNLNSEPTRKPASKRPRSIKQQRQQEALKKKSAAKKKA